MSNYRYCFQAIKAKFKTEKLYFMAKVVSILYYYWSI